MSSAFVVLAHTLPESLNLLLHELAPHPVVVHLDRAVDLQQYASAAPLLTSNHVTLAPSRTCVHWAGYSVVEAMLESLHHALEVLPPEVDHFTFLSGECFPLRPVDEYVQMLSETTHPVLCRGYAIADHANTKTMGLDRVTHRHWFDGALGPLRKNSPRAIGAALRKVAQTLTWPLSIRPPAIQHVAGSQWTSVPRELVDHC